MFDIFKNRLELTGTLTTVTALRIGAGRSSEPIGSDLPVIKDALGRPLIPGSSFKGAMRSRLESFLRGINPALAEDPASFTTPAKDRIVKGLKERHKDNDENLTTALIEITDPVARLLGTPWLSSKFQVRDLTVQADAWFGQYQERDGVAIDRDTETAADGKLYDFQVVPAGTPFEFRAIVENAEDWELGLLMMGLHQFATQQIPLGGGRSRGLGVVELKIDDVWWFDYPAEQPQELIAYLKRLVDGEKDHYKLEPATFEAHKQDWTNALVTYLNQAVTVTPASEVPANK